MGSSKDIVNLDDFIEMYGIFDSSSNQEQVPMVQQGTFPDLCFGSEFEEVSLAQLKSVAERRIEPEFEEMPLPQQTARTVAAASVSLHLEEPPPTQQGASSDHNPLPQQVVMPVQQQMAPELPLEQLKLISMTGAPSAEPLQKLPFKVTPLLPKDKPFNYTYTERFNMILTKMKKSFTIEFDYEPLSPRQLMYVRAVLLFADPNQAKNKVKTCKNHYEQLLVQHDKAQASCAADLHHREVLANSVLRSDNPGPGVYQCGDPSNSESWYSVVVAATGSTLRHTFSTECANSCSNGISNRKTLIVFTFEDQWGNVHARQVMGLRTCSSPFRDLRDMINGKPGGIKRNRSQRPRGKRARLQPGSIDQSATMTETNKYRSIVNPTGSDTTDCCPTESETTDFCPTESETTDCCPTETETYDIAPTEHRITELQIQIPAEVLNSRAVAFAVAQNAFDTYVRDHGVQDNRSVEIFQHINSCFKILREYEFPSG